MGGKEERERGKDGTDRWVLIIKILSFSLSPGKLAAENRLRRDVSITNGRYCRTAEESPLSSPLLPSSLLPLPHRRRGSPLGIVLLRGWKPVLRDRRTRPADFAAPALSSAFLLINFLPSQRRIKVEKNWNEISFLPTFPRSNGRGSTLAIHVGGEKLARKEGRKEGRGGEVGSVERGNEKSPR